MIHITVNIAANEDASCLHRDYGNGGTVCVCNEAHCDIIPPIEIVETNKYVVYMSDISGARFKKISGHFQQKSAKTFNKEIIISINLNSKYQVIHGWGGAFTDAAGIMITSLQDATKESLIK